MGDFDSLVEELLVAVGKTPELDHGPQNQPSEVRRVLYNLRNSPLVDQPSLITNLRITNLRAILEIKGDGGVTRGQIARMFDRFAEFRVAEHVLKTAILAHAQGTLIEFSEAPDIHVTVGSKRLHFGVEVKRPRLRAQDHVDEANLWGATCEDRLISYGDPGRVQEYLEEKVFKKAEWALRKSPVLRWMLFIVSDSPHQVEDVEVYAAAWHRYMYEGARCSGLCGVAIKDRGKAAMVPRLFIWEEAGCYKDMLAFLEYGFKIEALHA
jgi:hypothetical protein